MLDTVLYCLTMCPVVRAFLHQKLSNKIEVSKLWDISVSSQIPFYLTGSVNVHILNYGFISLIVDIFPTFVLLMIFSF